MKIHLNLFHLNCKIVVNRISIYKCILNYTSKLINYVKKLPIKVFDMDCSYLEDNIHNNDLTTTLYIFVYNP